MGKYIYNNIKTNKHFYHQIRLQREILNLNDSITTINLKIGDYKRLKDDAELINENENKENNDENKLKDGDLNKLLVK